MKSRIAVLLLVIVAVPLLAKKPPKPEGTIAQVYYWKAKPGKVDAYSQYIRDYAEPIDHEAQRKGAFLSITTYVSSDPNSPWTHMRIFILRDQAQLENLQKALDDAKLRLHPSEEERKHMDEQSTGLRDAVGHETVKILP